MCHQLVAQDVPVAGCAMAAVASAWFSADTALSELGREGAEEE